MKKREFLMSAAVIAALPLAAKAQQEKLNPCDPGPQTLNAAGQLLLLAQAEHGADGLRQALVAIAAQASPGCAQ